MKSFMAFYTILKRVNIHPFLFLVVFNSYAQPATIHDYILQESFAKAHHEIQEMDEQDPYKYLWASYNLSVQLLLNENTNRFNETYNSSIKAWEKACEKTSDTTPEHYFSLACISILQGAVNYIYDDKLTAFFQFKKAKRLSELSIKKYPVFTENKLLFGLLNISLGLIPERYSWITNPLGFRGIFKDGLSALEAYNKKNGLFKQESGLIHKLINCFLFDGNLKSLTSSTPRSSLEMIMYAAINIKSNKAQGAVDILNKCSTSSPFKKLLLAEAHLLLGEYNKAYIYSELFLSTTKGNNYKKAAYKFEYLAASLGQLNKDLTTLIKKIKDEGVPITSKDKEAASFAQKTQHINQCLYESRLLTDGGNFNKALTLLTDCPEATERTYRKARIFHLSGQTEAAIPLYLSVLQSIDEGKYYIANSSLQLGYIYWQKKNLSQSEYYFKKTRELPGDTYDEGINNKAKLALEVLHGK